MPHPSTLKPPGGGGGGGAVGRCCRSPAQVPPWTSKKLSRWDKANVLCLVKISVQRPCLSWDCRQVLSLDSNHQNRLLRWEVNCGSSLVGSAPCCFWRLRTKVSAAACGEVAAQWLQCDAVLIKILLHSHNVTDTSPNPNDTKYRSTRWIRMSPANYMDSIISCLLKQERKKKSKFVMIREVPAASGTLLESRQCLTVWDSTFTQQSIKSFGQWTIQVYMILMSPPPLPCPTELSQPLYSCVTVIFINFTVTILFKKTFDCCF